MNGQLCNIASIIQNIVYMYLKRGRVYDKQGCPKIWAIKRLNTIFLNHKK